MRGTATFYTLDGLGEHDVTRNLNGPVLFRDMQPVAIQKEQIVIPVRFFDAPGHVDRNGQSRNGLALVGAG